MNPLGILEDVLVQVNELIFPADFYVLDMEDEPSSKGSTLILGIPFLMIARTKIDMYVGTLSMEFGDNMVQFNIFEAMKHLIENYSIFGLDLHSNLYAFSEFFGFSYVVDLVDFECTYDGEVVEVIASQPPSPSIMQPLALAEIIA
ncbi:hypothetical protein CR513_03090, partial [Mucuna pruriens]